MRGVVAAERLDAWMTRVVEAYYAAGDPLGADGDFVTAPEVSQIFGEIIGLWAADAWTRMGRPAAFVLLECGPGRGTLMADALRAARVVPGLIDAARIILLETSAALREKQAVALKDCDPDWIESLDALPDLPVIAIANEFLDALPIRQLRFHAGRWEERHIGAGPVWLPACNDPPLPPPSARGGRGVYEISPAREAFVADLSVRIARRGGAALLIDYGYEGPAPGDTLQAVKNHRPVDPLTPGADVTAHVDLAPLKAAAARAGLRTHGPVGQGRFLLELGAARRAAQLGARDDLARLTAPDQMGTLFKVLSVESA